VPELERALKALQTSVKDSKSSLHLFKLKNDKLKIELNASLATQEELLEQNSAFDENHKLKCIELKEKAVMIEKLQ
jgi:hypothetical protein